MSLLKNIGYALSGTSAVMLITLFTAALNARNLGAAGLGTLAGVQAAAALTVGIFTFGIQQPLIKQLTEALNRHDEKSARNVVSLALIIDHSAALAAATAFLLTITAAKYLRVDQEILKFAIYYLPAIALSGTAAAAGILRATDRFKKLTAIQTLTAAAIAAASAILYLSNNKSISTHLISYAAITAISTMGLNWAALSALNQHEVRIHWRQAPNFSREQTSDFISHSATTYLTTLVESLRSSLDTLIISIIAGPQTVGMYTAARQLATGLRKVGAALNIAFFPAAARLSHAKDVTTAITYVKYTITTIFLLIFFTAVLLIPSGSVLLKFLYGPEFSTASTAMLILTAAAFLTILSSTLSGFIQTFGKHSWLRAVYLKAFLAHIIALPLLTYKSPLLGAAASQLVFAGFLAILIINSTRRAFSDH